MNHDDIRLEHAFLTVRNLERTLAWYRELFPAWAVRWSSDKSESGRWLHFGARGPGQPSYLSFWESTAATEADEPFSSARVQHIGFTHPDVSGLVRRLREAGIELKDEIIDDGAYRRAYFVDPDGHELEFVQAL